MKRSNSKPIARALASGLCAAVAGCSLVVDTSGLAGGSSVDVGAGDAASGDGGGGDGGGGGGGEGASPESGADGAAAARFCTGPAAAGYAFCEDFDGLTSLPGKFTGGTNEKNGGHARLDSSANASRSAPNGFTSSVPAVSCPVAALDTTFAGSFAAAKGSFDIDIESLGGTDMSFFALAIGKFNVWISATAGHVKLYTGLGPTYEEHPTMIPLNVGTGTWDTLAFDVDLVAGTAHVSLGGTSADVTFTPAAASGPIDVEIGFDCDQGSTPSVIHYDDVLLSVR